MATTDFARGSFPEHMYPRSCPSCGWGFMKDEWNETPSPTHCPRCGIVLERMACASCGAPVLLWHKQNGGTGRSPRCAWCGEDPDQGERKMRDKPAPKQAGPTRLTAGPQHGPFIIKNG